MKLLIADDHTLFRDALLQYIRRADSNIDVTVTKDFYEVHTLLKQGNNYDLVLLDLRMPGMDKMNGFIKIRDEFPNIKTALMSGIAEPSDVNHALDLGAVGYFPKTLSGKALVEGVQMVLSGEKFIPMDEKTEEVVPSYYFNGGANLRDSKNNHQDQTSDGDSNALTPREKDVLSYLAQGSSNKEIAAALGLQVVTIKLHVRGICRKLNVSNRTQAALMATQQGLVEHARIASS